jgi:beta-fructofuranosidase
MDNRTIESLPRELSLAADGGVRIRPLRELEALRRDSVTLTDLPGAELVRELLPNVAPPGKALTTFPADAAEVRVTVDRAQAARKLFGFVLFGGGGRGGMPIVFRPENGTLRVGSAEAPFSVADLPEGEDVQLRIFVDRYLVEVFANDRQSVVASYAGDRSRPALSAFTVAAPATIKKVEVWRIEPTNRGFLEARKSRVWEPASQ